MSGGAFEYDQYRIGHIVDSIEDILYKQKNPDEEDEYQQKYSEETILAFEMAIKYLKISQIYAHRIDWLLSGDDGEKTFLERLDKDLLDYDNE